MAHILYTDLTIRRQLRGFFVKYRHHGKSSEPSRHHADRNPTGRPRGPGGSCQTIWLDQRQRRQSTHDVVRRAARRVSVRRSRSHARTANGHLKGAHGTHGGEEIEILKRGFQKIAVACESPWRIHPLRSRLTSQLCFW